MNRLEMTIELKDWEPDSSSELPNVTKLHKAGEVFYPDYRHLDFILDTMYQFLLADSYSNEVILRFISEWVKDTAAINEINLEES